MNKWSMHCWLRSEANICSGLERMGNDTVLTPSWEVIICSELERMGNEADLTPSGNNPKSDRHWEEPSANNWLLVRILNTFFPNARGIHCYTCCIRSQYWLQRGVKQGNEENASREDRVKMWKIILSFSSTVQQTEKHNHQNKKKTPWSVKLKL